MPQKQQPNTAKQQDPADEESTAEGLRAFDAVRHVIQASQEFGLAQDEKQIYIILDEILPKLQYACAIFNIGENSIQLVNYFDKGGRKINLILRGPDSFNLRGMITDVPGSPRVFTTTEHILVDLALCPPEFIRLSELLGRLGFSTAIGFTIRENETPTRLIMISVDSKEMPSNTDLYPYDCLTAFASQALNRIQKTHLLESRLTNLETLSKMGETISLQTDLSALYELIHYTITGRLGEELSFAVAIYSSATQEIEIPYLYENNKVTSLEAFPLGQGLTTHLIETKKSLLLNRNTEKEAERLGAKIVGKTAKSWLGVPLIVNGEVIGAIIVQDTAQEGRFSEKDRAFLETLAPQLGISIRNAQLLEEMNYTLHKYDQEQFLLNSLLDNIPEKVYFKDSDGQYLRVSRSWINQFPPDQPPEFLGKTDLDLFQDESGSERHNREMEVIATTQASIGEIQEKVLPSGKKDWEWISRIPLVDESGRSTGLLGISQNISDLKNAEMASRRGAQQLQTASEIARDTAGSLDTALILKNAVNLIRERFNYYHASVFLVESEGKFAVLQEASGKTGEIMKKIGHRLAVGSSSLVGQATEHAVTVVVNDTHSHTDYYPNPLLPDTSAEVVVPLKIGDHVLGALDVQSEIKDAFLAEDLRTLEILADQLSIALENANLFTKTHEQISKQKLLRKLTTSASSSSEEDEAMQKITAGLTEALGSRVAIYFQSDDGALELRSFAGYDDQAVPAITVNFDEGLVGTAASQRHSVGYSEPAENLQLDGRNSEIRSALAVPIIYLDNLLGVLLLESTRAFSYDDNDRELLGSLGDSLGVIIANIRLLLQVRKQMEWQEKLFDISGKIRHSVDVDSILRTTAQEIGQKFAFSEVVIQLASPNSHETAAKITESA